MKKYSIVYADPPWPYKDRWFGRWSGYHYDLMPENAICNLDVASICNDNCLLFLWTTFPFLEVGLDVIRSWGFIYKTVAFLWIKRNTRSKTWFWGLGRWTRSNAEICLLGIKGKPKRVSGAVHQIVDEPVNRKQHSKRPNIVRDKIVELCGDLPRIELFAAQKVDGWSSWGNEVKNDIELNIKGEQIQK